MIENSSIWDYKVGSVSANYPCLKVKGEKQLIASVNDEKTFVKSNVDCFLKLGKTISNNTFLTWSKTLF